jgi:uncharacterized protein YciI
MFIIILTYTRPLEDIEQYIVEHRAFLDEGYKNNYFVASGPQVPRTGGVIISQLLSRNQLEDIIKQDPFNIHNLANFEIIEFNPIKYHPNFVSFMTK